MRHPSLLNRDDSLLLIIDVQESFRKAIPDFADLTKNISTLVEVSKILKLPVLVTEQYPEGLGRTDSALAACLGTHERFEKKSFSCCQQDQFRNVLSALGRKQVIVTGIECHVCVSQTVHDLLLLNYSPHLIVEAISSRVSKNKEIGLKKMIAAGAILSSLETAIFELLVESGTENFKVIQRLIK